jgi:hypothetical protein
MQIKRTLWFLTAGALLLMLTACPGPAPTTGTLEITVTAPAGVTPDVRVTGPSTDRPVATTGPTVLADLQPGEYQVVVNQVVVAGIGYGGTGTTLRVEAGRRATHNVNYVAESGAIRIDLTGTGLPTGLSPEVTLRNPDGTERPPTSSTATELDFHNLPPGNYTLEVPNRTQNGSTYASAQNGATVTVTAGEQATVNLAYTLNPGAATITVAGLVSALLSEVTVTLTRGTTAIDRTFTNNGPVSFPNLAPGTYTIAANAIVDNGDQDYAFTLFPTTLTIASGVTSSATLTYSRPTVTVNLTGLPVAPADANSVIVLAGGPASVAPTTTTITGTVRSATITVPRFGSYTVTATSVVAGTTVDSFYFSTTGVALEPSPVSHTPSANLPLTARGETGRMFVAGNGIFAPVGLNAIYSLSDAAIATGASLSNFLPTADTSSTEGYFKTAFDRHGNAYVIFQTFPGGTPARIVRISEGNLRAGNLAANAPGNKAILGSAISVPPPDGNEEVEPSDIAFDSSGNMWIANDRGSAIICISNAELNSPGATITSFDQAILAPNSFTGTLEGTYRFVRALAFDRQGNLWFTSDDTVLLDPNRLARLSRINARDLTCSGGVVRVAPDVLLDISNSAGTGEPFIKPAGLALSPDGNSLWVADYGGSTGKYRCVTPGTGDIRPACPGDSSRVVAETMLVEANAVQETLIQVSIAGISPGITLREAFVEPGLLLDRITIPAGTGTDRGLQQPFHIAFDKQDRLWLASNNNVIVTTTDTTSPCGFTLGVGQTAVCLPGTALTDRRGKLFGLTIGTRSGSDPALPLARDITPAVRITSAVDGVGFTGVAFNIAPVNAPMFARPTQ